MVSIFADLENVLSYRFRQISILCCDKPYVTTSGGKLWLFFFVFRMPKRICRTEKDLDVLEFAKMVSLTAIYSEILNEK